MAQTNDNFTWTILTRDASVHLVHTPKKGRQQLLPRTGASADSSDMNDDSDNDSMNDQTREEQAENRKGVG